MKTKGKATFLAFAITLCMASGVAFALAPELPVLTGNSVAGTASGKTRIAFTVQDDYSPFVQAVQNVATTQGSALEGSYYTGESANIVHDLYLRSVPGQAEASSLDSDITPYRQPAQAEYTRTIDINGSLVGYIDSFLVARAPEDTGGLWLGNDSTTDNSWGYFIGHNPGVFSPVLSLTYGSPVTIWDSDGNARTYHVVRMFDVPNTTTWDEVSSEITTLGEAVALQTCIQNGAYYHIVIGV